VKPQRGTGTEIAPAKGRLWADPSLGRTPHFAALDDLLDAAVVDLEGDPSPARDPISLTHSTTGVCEKDTPREKNTHSNLSFQSTKSSTGEQPLLLDCRATYCGTKHVVTDNPAHIII
jgi:hypothetical protein